MCSTATMATHPIRTCVGCRRTFEKSRLVRFSLVDDHVEVDARGRMDGRGCYVCTEPRCADAAFARDADRMQRALRNNRRMATTDVNELRRQWHDTAGQILKKT